MFFGFVTRIYNNSRLTRIRTQAYLDLPSFFTIGWSFRTHPTTIHKFFSDSRHISVLFHPSPFRYTRRQEARTRSRSTETCTCRWGRLWTQLSLRPSTWSSTLGTCRATWVLCWRASERTSTHHRQACPSQRWHAYMGRRKQRRRLPQQQQYRRLLQQHRQEHHSTHNFAVTTVSRTERQSSCSITRAERQTSPRVSVAARALSLSARRYQRLIKKRGEQKQHTTQQARSRSKQSRLCHAASCAQVRADTDGSTVRSRQRQTRDVSTTIMLVWSGSCTAQWFCEPILEQRTRSQRRSSARRSKQQKEHLGAKAQKEKEQLEAHILLDDSAHNAGAAGDQAILALVAAGARLFVMGGRFEGSWCTSSLVLLAT